MLRIFQNITKSNALLMVVLRYALAGVILVLGIARLRQVLYVLMHPASFSYQDILQEYLMAKALLSGINPYLPLNELARIFAGNIVYFPHPSPYPPFVAIMSIPLSWLSLNTFMIAWFIFEIFCLMVISSLLIIFWSGTWDWKKAFIIFLLFFAWYPIMADLTLGQLSILLTALLLAALFLLRKNHVILAGLLIGLTLSIKLITWPLLVYLVVKRNWRASLATITTTLGLNLLSLIFIGIAPFLQYYLHVSREVLSVWSSSAENYSLWSIGNRLFSGTRLPIFIANNNASTPFDSPYLALWVSGVLVAIYFIINLKWAIQLEDINTAYAIMVCMTVTISPMTWNHTFSIILIGLVILIRNLINKSFPLWPSIITLLILLSISFFNERIPGLIMSINERNGLTLNSGNHISFISSLLSGLPIIELLALTPLLRYSGLRQKKNITSAKI